jgi:hypothetical protein
MSTTQRRSKPIMEEASSKARVEKAIGDGAYDSEENFNYLAEKGVQACIRVRRSSKPRDGDTPREVAVREQLQSPGWERRQGYGYRWIVESAISSLKRSFGEHVSSTRWKRHGQRAHPQGVHIQPLHLHEPLNKQNPMPREEQRHKKHSYSTQQTLCQMEIT